MSTARRFHILVAVDSFKDALSANDVAQAVAAGLRQHTADVFVEEFPLADGGEGTYEVLAQHLKLRDVQVTSVDPLFRPIHAHYGIDDRRRLAFIEIAQASGLQLLTFDERNAAQTTTFGAGQLIADACRRTVERIVLAIGGSATNDGGIGMASALGWHFLDDNGQELRPVGDNLLRIARIEPPVSSPSITVDVLCDVTNPLFGGHGAAQVYARQKGANDASIARLDAGLHHLATLAGKQLHTSATPEIPGAGAAGGLGFGAMVFLGAKLHSGIELTMELTQFDAALARADVVITGEGALDMQTLHGKLIKGICRRANARGIPVIALCGQLSATAEQLRGIGLAAAYCINDGSGSLMERIAHTARDLQNTARTLSLPF